MRLFLICSLLIVSSCSNEFLNRSYDSYLGCRLDSFKYFFNDFSSGTINQRKYTIVPLEKLYINSLSDPEPSKIEINLALEQIEFPVIPFLEGLSFSIEADEGLGKAKVRVEKEDTDYQVIYFFQHDTCWNLFRIEDWSL